MARIPLEDNFNDVINKSPARLGRFQMQDLMKRAEVSAEPILPRRESRRADRRRAFGASRAT
jgi:succinate dehydrogenase/fumarate reductase flavoprotein subunit